MDKSRIWRGDRRMTLKELLRQYGDTTDPVKEVKIIEEWFVENDFEDLGLSMISRLSANKIKKLQDKLSFAQCWIPSRIDMNCNKEFADDKLTADMLNHIITYCMLSLSLPDDILKWAKENIPNINAPKYFFMPTVKYLKERYNIEFKDKPQCNF